MNEREWRGEMKEDRIKERQRERKDGGTRGREKWEGKEKTKEGASQRKESKEEEEENETEESGSEGKENGEAGDGMNKEEREEE